MNRPNMRLNNAVEEALGQGDCHYLASPAACVAQSFRTECGADSEETRDPSVLRINHAEEEHYGMSDHPAC